VAQLERDLIAERVRNGLANARAKGVRIGRLKTRDSDLIRKLRASGMTYRHYVGPAIMQSKWPDSIGNSGNKLRIITTTAGTLKLNYLPCI
jgi:hypothetical protein